MSRSHRDRPYKAVLAHSPSYDTNQMHFFSAQTHVCLESARSDGPDHADRLSTTYLYFMLFAHMQKMFQLSLLRCMCTHMHVRVCACVCMHGSGVIHYRWFTIFCLPLLWSRASLSAHGATICMT